MNCAARIIEKWTDDVVIQSCVHNEHNIFIRMSIRGHVMFVRCRCIVVGLSSDLPLSTERLYK